MAPPGQDILGIDGASKKEISTTVKKRQMGFNLQQIVIKQVSRSAVINGYVVHEGSYINKAKVTKISSHSVVILLAGKEQTLTLESERLKVRR